MKTSHRYVLFQIPGWLLGALVVFALWSWLELSPWTAAGLFLAWMAKDLLLYPLVRSAYETGVPTGVQQLIGAAGVVHEELAPRGYVMVRGELWRAEAEPPAPLPAGTPIRVRAAQGLTLIVAAETLTARPSPPRADDRTVPSTGNAPRNSGGSPR